MPIIQVETELVTTKHELKDTRKLLNEALTKISQLEKKNKYYHTQNHALQKEIDYLKDMIKVAKEFRPIYG